NNCFNPFMNPFTWFSVVVWTLCVNIFCVSISTPTISVNVPPISIPTKTLIKLYLHVQIVCSCFLFFLSTTFCVYFPLVQHLFVHYLPRLIHKLIQRRIYLY